MFREPSAETAFQPSAQVGRLCNLIHRTRGQVGVPMIWHVLQETLQLTFGGLLKAIEGGGSRALVVSSAAAVSPSSPTHRDLGGA